MNRSIEQSLLSLLPTHNSALPPNLVQLASSLLAQSRLRASTLKADEDLARPYACAHIACDRLKITLDLPPIEPRPPIPPRIYKRLYTHLNNILPNTGTTPKARRVATPSSQRREALEDASPLAGRSASALKSKNYTPLRNNEVTPSKRPSAQATSSSKRPRHPRKQPRTSRTELPLWLRPTIRFLIAHLPGCARLGPTLAAGMSAMWTGDGAWARDNPTAALAATAYYASQRLVGRDMEPEAFAEVEGTFVEVFGRVRDEVEVKVKVDEEEEKWEGWKDLGVAEFRLAVVEFSDGGYMESDWFEGVDDLKAAEVDEGERAGKGGSGETVKVRRADSMLQERYDFLSKRKQDEYRKWKAGIMRRIVAIEREKGDAMEVDG